ncbi:hypothetical protein [Flavivirga aquatica]|nr:hypothetical protein [Flavivirga aquatica]
MRQNDIQVVGFYKVEMTRIEKLETGESKNGTMSFLYEGSLDGVL